MKKVRSLNRININEEDIDLQRTYVTFEKYSCGENKKKLSYLRPQIDFMMYMIAILNSLW